MTHTCTTFLVSDYYFPGIRDAATDRHESLLVEILISWRRRTTNTTNEITETTTISETTEPTEAPFPEGMGSIKRNQKSLYSRHH